MRSNKRPHFLFSLSACVVLLVWMCSGSSVWAEGKMDFGLDRAVKALGDTERLHTIPGVFYSGGEPHVKLFLKLSDVPPRDSGGRGRIEGKVRERLHRKDASGSGNEPGVSCRR